MTDIMKDFKAWLFDKAESGHSYEHIIDELLAAGWEKTQAEEAVAATLKELFTEEAQQQDGERKDALPKDWRQRICASLLLHGSMDRALSLAKNAGFSEEQVAAEINSILTDPCFKAAQGHKDLHLKTEDVLLNHARLVQRRRDSDTIARVSGLSKQDFFDHYYFTSTPVILTDFAQDWQAHSTWKLPLLKKRFLGIDVEIQQGRNSEKAYEINSPNHKRVVNFADFIDMAMRPETNNDVYLTANNQALRDSPLKAMLDDVGTLPEYLDEAEFASRTFLWIGPAGTITPLHHDKNSLFHTNFQGSKSWKLISPFETPRMYNHAGVFSAVDIMDIDDEKYPKFKDIHVIDVTIAEGETLFLPVGWWHSVVSNEPCVSLSTTSIATDNDYEYHEFDNRSWMDY